MAITIRTQANLKLTDPIVGVAINQQKISIDAESSTLNMNFTAETYELPATSDWVKISKGDIGKIRDIFLFLISDPQTENIDVIITDSADPNVGPLPKTFSMRDMFIATANMDTGQNIWVKNSGSAVAVLMAIIGGENA